MPGEDLGTWDEKDWLITAALLRAVISLTCWLLLLNSRLLGELPCSPQLEGQAGEDAAGG